MSARTTTIQNSHSRWFKSRRSWGSYLVYLILFAGIFMTLMPFIWMILGILQNRHRANSGSANLLA